MKFLVLLFSFVFALTMNELRSEAAVMNQLVPEDAFVPKTFSVSFYDERSGKGGVVGQWSNRPACVPVIGEDGEEVEYLGHLFEYPKPKRISICRFKAKGCPMDSIDLVQCQLSLFFSYDKWTITKYPGTILENLSAFQYKHQEGVEGSSPAKLEKVHFPKGKTGKKQCGGEAGSAVTVHAAGLDHKGECKAAGEDEVVRTTIVNHDGKKWIKHEQFSNNSGAAGDEESMDKTRAELQKMCESAPKTEGNKTLKGVMTSMIRLDTCTHVIAEDELEVFGPFFTMSVQK
eukprot:Nk52_evm63s2367 gene=Nk52_evmTU63s2367